ncbi:MAG TPA: amino acid ABC transporter permease [Actinomycetota bacterium]|nr:amino acid ABC transporter permease [Actinomycetota bacterium]
MEYLFSPDNWRWLFTGNNLRFLFEGFLVNLQIAGICMVLSLAIGLLLALGRLSRSRVLRTPVGAWIDAWRNLPIIFVMLFLSLALPGSWKAAYEELAPGFLPEALRTGRVLAAFLALTLYNSAVIAEIFRAGIQSLERGQGEAAAALGLTRWKAMRLVILPQGLRRMVPATVSQLITLNKDTTLVSIIAIQEVMRHGRIVTSFGFFGTTPAPVLQVFLVVGVMFVVVNLTLSRLSRRLEIRQRERTGVELEAVTGVEDQAALAAEPA